MDVVISQLRIVVDIGDEVIGVQIEGQVDEIVAIQTLAENKRSSTTMQELKNPCKIKAFSLLKGGILKKPCVTRSSNIFRFWGEKSALGRRWGELGEKITVLNADDTYLRAE